jgi:hypothetical protein
MISSQKMDVLWVPEFVDKQERNNLDVKATTIHVITQEEHLFGFRCSELFQHMEKVIKLT